MVLGILLALIAGSLVGIQNIFNNKVNEHTGTWTTTTLVLGLGFAASFVIGLLLEGKNMFALRDMQAWFYFSGLIGVGVVTCMVQGVKRLGPTYAVAIVMTSGAGICFVVRFHGLARAAEGSVYAETADWRIGHRRRDLRV